MPGNTNNSNFVPNSTNSENDPLRIRAEEFLNSLDDFDANIFGDDVDFEETPGTTIPGEIRQIDPLPIARQEVTTNDGSTINAWFNVGEAQILQRSMERGGHIPSNIEGARNVSEITDTITNATTGFVNIDTARPQSEIISRVREIELRLLEALINQPIGASAVDDSAVDNIRVEVGPLQFGIQNTPVGPRGYSFREITHRNLSNGNIIGRREEEEASNNDRVFVPPIPRTRSTRPWNGSLDGTITSNSIYEYLKSSIRSTKPNKYEVVPYSVNKFAVPKSKMNEYRPIRYNDGENTHYGFRLENKKAEIEGKHEIVYKHVKTGKLKREIVSISHLFSDVNAIYQLCKAKINSHQQSAKLFGFKNIKKSMAEATYEDKPESKLLYEITGVNFDYICNKDEQKRDCIILKGSKGNIKFLMSDCEIVYPNITGAHMSKNREIKIGSLVKCIDNRRSRIIKGDKLKVIKIYKPKSGNPSYDKSGYGKKINTNKKKLIELEDSSGVIHKNYLENFKVI